MIVGSRPSAFHSALVRFFCLLWPLTLASFSAADTEYYRHILFDNGLDSDAYYYSAGKASSPSTLELNHDKLPVSKTVFYTPPNALRLKWRSVLDGGWEASIRAIHFRNRPVSLRGDALYFWCFSEEGISPGDLPLVHLSDSNEQFSKPLRLERFVKDLPAKRWVQVRIPLQEFESGSLHWFQPKRTDKVVFVQGAPDSADHTLIVDEIKIDKTVDSTRDVSKSDSNLPAPRNVSAEGYERHVDIRWDPVEAPELQRYVVYRSRDNRDFQPIGIQVPGINRFTDYLGQPGKMAFYKVAWSDHAYRESPLSEAVTGKTAP
jgi:exo beta-1,2-glucooligosaccharide sophorohydrolase (non-reducing end)